MIAYITLYVILYVLFAIKILFRKGLLFAFAIALLLVFTAARYGIGWDYWAYHDTIVFDADTNIVSRGEWLTLQLVEFARGINSFVAYFSLNALIFFFAFYLFVRRFSVDLWLSLFIFSGFPLFFLNSLSVVRNFTAIAIVLLALRFLTANKIAPYVALVFVASLFHKSAYFALLFPILIYIKIPRWGWFALLLLAGLIGASIVNNIFDFVGDYFPEYIGYVSLAESQQGTKAVYVLAGFALIFNHYRKSLCREDGVLLLLLDIYLFGVFVYLMFLPLGTLGHRLSLYSTILLVVLVPRLLEIVRPTWVRRLATVAVHVSFIVFFFWTIVVMEEAYLPYRTIFD